MLTVLGGFSFG